MKALRLFFILIITAIAGGCSKNEFSIDFQIADAGTQNVRIVYLASSADTEILIDMMMPITDGKLHLDGVTRFPTVVYVFSSSGTLLNTIYAERGDKLTVAGSMASPYAWKVQGNSHSEAYAKWLASKTDLLKSGDAGALNSAITDYFKSSDRDDVAASIMLLTLYSERNDKADFQSLWDKLKDTEERDQLRKATMSGAGTASDAASRLHLTPIPLLSAADTMSQIIPSAHDYTVIYLWYNSPDAKDLNTLNALSDKADVMVADVCVSPDTVQWRQNLRYSPDLHKASFWALGASGNNALHRLSIDRYPYIILSDRKGNQLYRGDNINSLTSTLNRLIEKKTK